jgi:hypothetical protein
MKRAAIASLLVVLLAACQDHHFVPMEKADTIKLPTGRETIPLRGFAEAPQAQKQVMAEANRQYSPPPAPVAPPKPGQLIAEGSLELGGEQQKRDFTGFSIYVIVRSFNLQGPPIAATRLKTGKFPIKFRVDTNDLMMGVPPATGVKLMVEARMDRDGDPITKEKGDVWGITIDPIALGTKNVRIVLNQDRK